MVVIAATKGGVNKEVVIVNLKPRWLLTHVYITLCNYTLHHNKQIKVIGLPTTKEGLKKQLERQGRRTK